MLRYRGSIVFICICLTNIGALGLEISDIEKIKGERTVFLSDSIQSTATRYSCRQTLTRIVGLGGTLTAVGAIPILIHQIQSFTRQAPHIGFGIYFDWDNIVSHLTAEERELLKYSGQNLKQILKMFISKLYGGDPSDDGKGGQIVWSTLVLHPNTVRFASSFLDSRVKDRGVCRHKATILYKILKQLGIEAELRVADAREEKNEPTFSHVFVYLPKSNLIADPMNNMIEDATEYRKILFIENERDFDMTRAVLGYYAP